jgi:hypothetical protein
MYEVIDSLTSLTGWTASGGAVLFGVNQIPDFVAGINDSSLIFKFPSGSLNGYVSKTGMNFDFTSFDEIVFHFWSRNKKRKGATYQLSSDFVYEMQFYRSGVRIKGILIPTFDQFIDVTFKADGLGIIDEIRIVCLHNDEDYVIVSNMVAVHDDIPRDIFQSVKDQLEYDLENNIYFKFGNGTSKGILLGHVTASLNDQSIIFSGSIQFMERYSVVVIDDGTNSEKHQIDSNDELEFFFNSKFDGATIKHNFINASVYLLITIEYGRAEDDIELPGISIWGMNPEEVYDVNKLDHVRDTFKDDDTVQERKADAKFRYVILIDCEARHNEMIGVMSLLVRSFIANQYLWVNGKRIEIFSDGTSTYLEPVEGFNEIPKIQFVVRVDIKEQINNRQTLVKTLQNVLTYSFKEDIDE